MRSSALCDSQPKGLCSLFLTTLWERFGFYLVQAILVLYLTQKLSYTDQSAYLLYGAFSALLYLTPFVGGILADRYLGFRRCVILGGILLSLGYFVMGLPNQEALFLGLSILIVGNGLFKPNISSLVGCLYSKNDPRQEGGFTLFYMGINIGSMIPPLFIGAFIAVHSWASGFFLAFLGMLFALIIFFSTQKTLGRFGNIPASSPLNRRRHISFYLFFLCGVVATVFLSYLLFYHPEKANAFLIFASLIILAALIFFLFRERTQQRKRLGACLILILLSIGFWAIYMQTYTSLILFADRNIQKELFGIPINAEFTLFFNPFYIVLLSPLLSRLWTRLELRGRNPSTPLKFSLGILLISLGFLLLWAGNESSNQGGLASPWWLVLSYLIQTLGELLLSPIGLAMITRLSPPRLVGTMMGVWFLTLAASFSIGGGLATLSTVPSGTSPLEALHIYDHAFLVYGLLSLGLAAFSFALVPFLNRLIGPPPLPERTPKA